MIDFIHEFLCAAELIGSLIILGFVASLVFEAWLDAKRERERAKRLEQFQEQVRRDKI